MQKLGGAAVLALTAVTATVDAVAAVIHHVHMQTGLDLALADQAVWHYSRFETPFSSILGKNVLGDHFSPIVALLAPLYWIWSDPRTLLVAQSILIAASIVPVFAFAERRVGRTAALLIAVAYACFWGIQVGALYDFHELAFAPLLIALAILFADTAVLEPTARRWARFWVVIVLLLAVKEDLSLLVTTFGLYLLTRRQLRHGVALVAIGIAWYFLCTKVLIPHFSHGAAYSHWTYTQLGKDLPGAVWALLRAPWQLFTIALSPSQKLHTLVALFAPFLFLSFGSRLFILALPLLAERFLSADPVFWVGHYHYSLPVAPVLAMAAASGLGNLGGLVNVRRRRRLLLGVSGAILLTSLAITRLGSPDSGLSELTRPSFFNEPAYAMGASAALAQIPSDASLSTVDAALPHASERAELRLLSPGAYGRSDYMLAGVIKPECCATGNASYAAQGRLMDAELARMTPVFYDSGWLVTRRPAGGQAAGNGVLTPIPAPWAARIAVRTRRLLVAYVNLAKCLRPPAARPASDCAAAASRAARMGYLRAIAPAKATHRGGCASLAAAAGADATLLVADLTRAATAATGPKRSLMTRALVSAATDNNNFDLVGGIQRLVILCSPRPVRRQTP